MGKYSDFYQARQKILEIVQQDLLGPVYEKEIINEAPTSYYLMGKLYPRTDADLDMDENTSSTEITSLDEDSSLASANVREPHAMGMTITVKPNVSRIKVAINFATYIPYSYEEAKECNIPLDRYAHLIERADEKEQKRMTFWQRKAHHYAPYGMGKCRSSYPLYGRSV